MIQIPDNHSVVQWLSQIQQPHYTCESCHAFHLSDRQDDTTSADTRLFVEDYGLLLTTEVMVRPTLVVHLLAEMSGINAGYPFLKVFVDLADQEWPRLVVANTLLVGSIGVSFEQFRLFFETTQTAAAEVLAEVEAFVWQEDSLLDTLGSGKVSMH